MAFAAKVRRFTCLTCSDFSKERVAAEDSRREETLNSEWWVSIHRSESCRDNVVASTEIAQITWAD